ncbi:hypothetical protein KDA00_01530 [Candidatus Saccharibacteria bacterium]|nr:hypothetical protein [Candidatus Saccharibacteria bacterium]
MKVMGHRGAAGLALENTLNSFEMAKLLGVDFIELDIHKTADGELVVVHDNDLRRISNQSISIKNSSLKDIQKICLIDAQSVVPTLKQVINATEGVPLVIEIKSDGCVDELTKLLKKHKDRDIAIASFRHNELKLLRSKVPEYSDSKELNQ